MLQRDALDRLGGTLVLEFFWTFSVFECALKRSRFLQLPKKPRPGREYRASPDWNRFGDEISGKLKDIETHEFRAAVRTLMSTPPFRQVVRNGAIDWVPVVRGPRESEERHILELVKTIRNNLFHGGKYPGIDVAEVARNKELIGAALLVLNHCRELHEGVAQHFRESAWTVAA